jgi:hypothetical protein
MEKKNNIDKLFSDKIDSFEMSPEKDIWGSLDNQLNAKANIGYKTSILKLKVILFATASILGVFTIYHFSNLTNKEDSNHSHSEITTTDNDNSLVNQKTERVNSIKLNHTNKKSKNLQEQVTSDKISKNTDKLKSTSKSSLKEHKNEINNSIFSNKEIKNNLISKNGPDSDRQLLKQTKKELDQRIVSKTNPKSANFNQKASQNSTTIADQNKQLEESNSELSSSGLSDSLNLEQNTANYEQFVERNESFENHIPSQNENARAESPERITMDPIRFKPLSLVTNLPQLHTSAFNTIKETSNKSFENWFISIYYMPEKVFTNLQAQDNFGQNLIEEYKNKDESAFSYSTGFNISYSLSPKWKLSTGVGGISYVQNTSEKALHLEEDPEEDDEFYYYSTSYGEYQIFDTEDSNEELDSVIQTNYSSENIQLVTIPLFVSYKYAFKRFYISGELGINASRIIKDEIVISFNKTNYDLTPLSSKKEYQFGMQMGFGLGYYLTPKLSVALTPCFKKSFTPLNLDTDVQTTFSSFGLAGKIAWNF